MNVLITSDLHLSDRPRDTYRFPIFKWLAQQQQKYNVSATFILGDITDRKDNHSAALVNRIIDELLQLRPPVYILRGNHDGLDPNNPFFRFLRTIEGLDFVVRPKCENGVSFVPHQSTQEAFDFACEQALPSVGPPIPMLVTHQCFDGAIAETGSRLSGLSAPVVRLRPPLRWYSGDVHRPHQLACGVVYAGSPFSVRFGDDFDHRVLLVRDSEAVDLHYPCLKKHALRIKSSKDLLSNQQLKKGDQVKVTVILSRAKIIDWAAEKAKVLAVCKELGLDVFGCDLEIPEEQPKNTERGQSVYHSASNTFEAYCQAEGLAGPIIEAGQAIMG